MIKVINSNDKIILFIILFDKDINDTANSLNVVSLIPSVKVFWSMIKVKVL